MYTTSTNPAPHEDRLTMLKANTFFEMSHTKDPHKWPVQQFYEDVMSPESGLKSLLYADVTDIACCQGVSDRHDWYPSDLHLIPQSIRIPSLASAGSCSCLYW